MAKNNRGKLLYRQPSRSRGTCPICLATRIKLLDTQRKSDGTVLKVCKRCVGASKQRIEAAVDVTTPLAFRRRHKKAFHQLKVQ
ncbi:hypothetical protein [Paenibacillus endoradicis]|uniref:hypothetical protein n=1 Tax=Paenibacillus endoradicis TaxID=2972487 RepID=UPI002158D6B4|nr:hypothetical protein [Paenibacillus endoradicis]MCR8659152.1 hypothetical protein [Paenibacillus endoradicis]